MRILLNRVCLCVIELASFGDTSLEVSSFEVSYVVQAGFSLEICWMLRSGLLECDLVLVSAYLRKVPLEDESPSLAPGELISSTNTHQSQLCVFHLFYAYVRKTTNTEFNVFVLGRDLIMVCDSLAKQLHTSLKICE
ncbi:hypothetical protein F511_23145 [Dorcoceras hygrometricum]|uniref:Uncharacterized protein n=1 Tax=Dorcoceras hygrometricum TaxID=472368 RepID=A0A2Z7AB14_9LAMI|nr:hypothetical protein F511_23145 [Dorcoceras hygrometricum]